MSDMPARLLSQAQHPTKVDKDKAAASRGRRSPSSAESGQVGSQKGKSKSGKDSNVESAEEDELMDGSVSPFSSILPGQGAARSGSLKRKGSKADHLAESSKRSRSLVDSTSTQAGPSSSRVPSTLQESLEQTAEGNVRRSASSDRSSHSTSVSRRGSLSSESANNSVTGRPGAVLTTEEVNEFLTLIYKHHPEPMTAQNMKKSVDALHHDWQTYCISRDAPVMAKKPLMDEYGKIFNGVYGSRFQERARAIAQELSQRSLSSGNSEEQQRESRTSRGGASDLGSEAEDSDVSGDEAADKPKDETIDDSQDPANPVASASSSSNVKKSNIARVGRNGLAVLPPGLFDILRTHLRDDILSGIMPMVRSDLSEQTRELYLQNQDLFNRIRDMEEQIRNQDLWIRHLLARDSDWPPHHAPVGPTGNVVPNPLQRSFGAASKDSSNSRTSRYGPPSESEYLPPHTGQSGGDGISPRQQRFEKRPSHQHGVAGPTMWDSRSAGAPPSGRWDGFAHAIGQDRRSSYAVDLSYRKDSLAEDFGSHGYRGKLERPEFAEPRFDAIHHRRGSRPATTSERVGGGPVGVVGPAGGQHFPGHPQQQPQLGRPISPQDDFRRPMQPGHSSMLGEGGSPPGSGPMYDTRRPYPGFVTNPPESHFSPGVDPVSSSMLASQTVRSPLPPRSSITTPDAIVARNKRGRPTNAETLIRTNM